MLMRRSRYLTLGALAGAAGTAAMDLMLYRRYQRRGGKDPLWQWECAGGRPDDLRAGSRGVVAPHHSGSPPMRWARSASALARVSNATGLGTWVANHVQCFKSMGSHRC